MGDARVVGEGCPGDIVGEVPMGPGPLPAGADCPLGLEVNIVGAGNSAEQAADTGRGEHTARRHTPVPALPQSRQDRFLDLLTATACEVTVDANASEPSFLQDSKRTEVVRGRSGVQWTLGSLCKKNL